MMGPMLSEFKSIGCKIPWWMSQQQQQEECCSNFGLFWGKILCNAGLPGRPNPDANGPLRSTTLALLQPLVPALLHL